MTLEHGWQLVGNLERINNGNCDEYCINKEQQENFDCNGEKNEQRKTNQSDRNLHRQI